MLVSEIAVSFDMSSEFRTSRNERAMKDNRNMKKGVSERIYSGGGLNEKRKKRPNDRLRIL
jgi:hypothetical protein